MSDTVQLFVDAWKLMVGRLPLPTIKEDDGVVSCFGNVPLIFLNLSIVERPAETDDELRIFLNTAVRHAAICKYPQACFCAVTGYRLGGRIWSVRPTSHPWSN